MAQHWQKEEYSDLPDYLGDPRFIPMGIDTFEILVDTSREGLHLELVDGMLYNMAPPTDNHETIKHNLYHNFRTQMMQAGPCRVTTEQYVGREGIASTRPDITITCNLADWHPDEVSETHRRITSPLVVVEVLSPSTKRFDRGEKLERLKQFETLAAYILVHYQTPLIEVYQRINDWKKEVFTASQTAHLDPLDLEIEVDATYEYVVFPSNKKKKREKPKNAPE